MTVSDLNKLKSNLAKSLKCKNSRSQLLKRYPIRILFTRKLYKMRNILQQGLKQRRLKPPQTTSFCIEFIGEEISVILEVSAFKLWLPRYFGLTLKCAKFEQD